MYAIKAGQFEGPLDLLLTLIEKRKMSINDVSLTEITDQYLDYLKHLEDFPMEEVALFIGISSTLMLIKSRSLMPTLELTESEEESIEDLEKRLVIYRYIRDLSLKMARSFGKRPVFSREGFKGIDMGFIEPKGVNAQILQETLKSVIDNLPQKECLTEAQVKKIISLEEKILELTERIKNKLEISFEEFVNLDKKEKDEKKIEIIVSFLAMLELVKQGVVSANQNNLFDNINICYGKS